MISPHSTDAESYETTLALIGRVAPTMPPAARSRAAWNVASAKLDLKAAVAAEGFALDGVAAQPAVRVDPTKNPNHKPAPPSQAQLDALAANIARTRAEIAAYRDGPPASSAAVNFPVEADHAGEFPPGYNAKTLAVHKAAMRLMTVIPMKYGAAIATVTRGMK